MVSVNGEVPSRMSDFAKDRSSVAGLSWAALLGVFALSAWSRYLVVDQAQLLNHAAQFLAGRVLYSELPDTHLPATVLVFSVPVLLSRLSGLSPILAFNIFVSLVTALCALAGARFATGRNAPGLAALLAAIAFLAQNDALFGQRDSLFHIVWLTYLVARLSLPRAVPALELSVGLAAGFCTAIKPQFLVYAFVDEAVLLWWTRSLRHPALIGAVISGTSVIVLLFTFFDWRDYFKVLQFGEAYYRIVGLPPSTVLANMWLSPSLRAAVWLIAACLAWWAWVRRVPRLAILLMTVIVVTVPLVVQQGHARSYYFIGITLPALMLGAMVVAEALTNWTAPGGNIGPGKRTERQGLGLVQVTASAIIVAAGICVICGPDVGVAAQAWQRLRTRQSVALLGPPQVDPFVKDWERRSRPGESFTVLNAQYGFVAFDPLVSAIRLNQPIYSRYNGVELDFLFAFVDGDQRRLARACEGIESDLTFAHATWLYIRQDVPPWAKPGEFNEQLHAVPRCASAIDDDYAKVDAFDRYVVYRRR
jgi:hypothetical protein